MRSVRVAPSNLAATQGSQPSTLDSQPLERSVGVAPSNLAATQGSQPFTLEEIPGFLTQHECAAVIAVAQVIIKGSADAYHITQ